MESLEIVGQVKVFFFFLIKLGYSKKASNRISKYETCNMYVRYLRNTNAVA